MKKTKSGLIICKNCDAVYYKKFWHRNLRHYKNLKEDLAVKFALCPACEMIKNKQFEGEIIIKNIPIKIKSDLINLAKTFSKRALERDPMHRLIDIKEAKDGLKITTTENQLAVKLAKKIKETFKFARAGKEAELKIAYSPAPSDVVYVKIIFD